MQWCAHSWLRAHQLLVSKMYAPARFHFVVNLVCLIWAVFKNALRYSIHKEPVPAG
jgi:hypothetical protein